MTVTPPRPAHAGPHPGLVFLAWTCSGLFFGMQGYVNHLLFGVPREPRPVWVVLSLADAWYWALLTFPVFFLAHRFRFTRRGWPLAVAVHLAETQAEVGSEPGRSSRTPSCAAAASRCGCST